MYPTLKKLYKIHLLSPLGLYRLLGPCLRGGVNLMALLRFASCTFADRIALTDDQEDLSFTQLEQRVKSLAFALKQHYNIEPGKRVALLCRNNAPLLISIFASSLLGADVYLLNADMSTEQLSALCKSHNFDLLIHDEQFGEKVQRSGYSKATLSTYGAANASVEQWSRVREASGFVHERVKAGKLIVLTSGTTGAFKLASRKPSLVSYLAPFLALVSNCQFDECESVYIGVPVYHGFGLASVFLSLFLGVRMYLNEKFEPAKAGKLIGANKIPAMVVVPLMLSKMLDENKGALASLKSVISGGAALSPALVSRTQKELGDVLYNLYGTSEAGFVVLATPAMLRLQPTTLGKLIRGARLVILNERSVELQSGQVGRICIQCRWAAYQSEKKYIDTGDLGYIDPSGYLYLCGRADDMIVSGGENVYPIELERIIVQHSDVQDVAVVGVEDTVFGSRLRALVQLKPNSELNENDLRAWLMLHAARYQMPRDIEFVETIEYNSLGKALNTKR